MTKADLITKIAEKSELSKKDSEKALNAVIAAVTDALVEGDKVQLTGFGTFEARERAARKGINPLTKAPIDIAASVVPAFKAGKGFKDAIK